MYKLKLALQTIFVAAIHAAFGGTLKRGKLQSHRHSGEWRSQEFSWQHEHDRTFEKHAIEKLGMYQAAGLPIRNVELLRGDFF